LNSAFVAGSIGPILCPDQSRELEVNLCPADFKDRDAGIASFRNILTDLESVFSWFDHDEAEPGRAQMQIAEYLELPGNNLLNDHNLQFRHRRMISGKDAGEVDFTAKYKEGVAFYPPVENLKPMTAAAQWQDFWKCKVEDNVKYLACPYKPCYPVDQCSAPCPDKGPAGVGLEMQEQAPKMKSDADEAFAMAYPTASDVATLADVNTLFPDVVGHFNLGETSTPLHVSVTQYRYIFEKVITYINGAEVESEFVLFYNSLEDLNAGGAPASAVWSFKIEEGEDNWAYAGEADELLKAVGERIQCDGQLQVL